jgi:hypothetical protein
MKNRYGMDGMTYSVKVDTSTGHFDVSSHIEEDDDNVVSQQSSSKFGNIDSVDKALIKQKFFELTN